jgi:beta-N-acetylhexosaminidase
VDFSFTPVLDLDHGRSGVIGDRAFHRDPRVVTLLAKSLMHGLLLAGMGNCGKHFPGHGHAKADSHVAVPQDTRSLKAILADDALPYAGLSTCLSAVMPAHVVYPKVDHRPAGFSPRWLKDILRGQLGFTGAIFSDDLSMEGARHLGPPRAEASALKPGRVRSSRGPAVADGSGQLSHAEAAALALDAGCDLVLLCNQSQGEGEAVDQLLAGLQQQAQAGHWQPDPDSEARRLALLPQSPPLTWDELMHQGAYQHALERLP